MKDGSNSSPKVWDVTLSPHWNHSSLNDGYKIIEALEVQNKGCNFTLGIIS